MPTAELDGAQFGGFRIDWFGLDWIALSPFLAEYLRCFNDPIKWRTACRPLEKEPKMLKQQELMYESL